MDDIMQSLKTFFTQPAWLFPTLVSVAVQLVATHYVKVLLPPTWSASKRDAVIWLISCVIGVSAFVPTRWAWLTIDGQPFTAAHFVLSVGVALLVIAAMPWIYSKLPEQFREAYSYRRQIERREE